MDLYKELCQGRSFQEESGKITSIHHPSIRYFAYFISKCVLARKTASKLSSHDLAFIATALTCDRTFNLGALIASRLEGNREKGGICGGLIASRLLAYHGLVPHALDFAFPIEKLDIESMIKHKFVLENSHMNNLFYEITFLKKSGWRVKRTERLVKLPAPALFNLFDRTRWSLIEGELDTYIGDHDQHAGGDAGGAGDDFQDFGAAESSSQQPNYDYGASASSSTHHDYDYASCDPPAWSSYRCWD
jgi:hypothetical protein